MTSPDSHFGIRSKAAAIAAKHPRVIAGEAAAHSQVMSEYESSILAEALTLEDSPAYLQPSLELFQQQPEISLRMRPLLLDYLMEITHKLRLHNDVFYTTVNIIDRYCSVRVVRKQHFQLLGLTALWLASKLQENKLKIVSLNDLLTICCHCYAKTLFVEMEQHILKSLQWMLNAPTVDLFTTLFTLGRSERSKEALSDRSAQSYLGELAQFYPAVCYQFKPSAIAQGAIDLVDRAVEFDSMFFDKSRTPALTSAMVRHFSTTGTALGAILLKHVKGPPPALKTRYFTAPTAAITTMVQYANYYKAYIQFTENQRLFMTPSTPCPSDAGIGGMATPPATLDYTSVSTPTQQCPRFELPSPEWSPGKNSDYTAPVVVPAGYFTPPITPHDGSHDRKRSHPLLSCVYGPKRARN